MLGRCVKVCVYILFAISTIAVAPSAHAEVQGIPRTQESGYCPAVTTNLETHNKKTSTHIQAFKGEIKAASIEAPATAEAKKIEETPTPSSQDKPPSMSSDLIMQLINDHRKSMGLPEFQKEERLCALARERGPELAGEAASGDIHGGFNARNLPYWITENMKYGTGTEQDFFNWWLGSSIHRKAIESDATYSCGECYGNACIQLFTSYIPK